MPLFQRLEFLGDSVLDLLITRYLYVTHTDVDPGELTDLRSALVSNENFAEVVLRNNIHSHLQHGSGILLEQITEYVRSNLECQGKVNKFLQHATCKVPKVRNTVSLMFIILTAYLFIFVLLLFLRWPFLCEAFPSQHYT